MSDYLVSVSKNYYPSKEENVVKSIFSQYESVIIYSLITSFGLDFLIKDQHGGDVDTIHNVRQIGKDLEMTYKNKQNEESYETRGELTGIQAFGYLANSVHLHLLGYHIIFANG